MKRTGMSRGRVPRTRTWFRAYSSCTRAAVSVPVVLLTIVLGSNVLQRSPDVLVIEPELLTRLQTLAEGLHQEVVLCLKGSVRGNRAIVDDFVMPVPRLSTPTRSSFERCPRQTLASWHNHPPNMLAPIGTRVSAASDAHRARRLCVLSQTDIQTAGRLRHPFVVVSVDAKTWCWWGLDEVDQFAAADISPAPPSPERIARADGTEAWARPSTSASPQ
jgi:hypothetical protein